MDRCSLRIRSEDLGPVGWQEPRTRPGAPLPQPRRRDEPGPSIGRDPVPGLAFRLDLGHDVVDVRGGTATRSAMLDPLADRVPTQLMRPTPLPSSSVPALRSRPATAGDAASGTGRDPQAAGAGMHGHGSSGSSGSRRSRTVSGAKSPARMTTPATMSMTGPDREVLVGEPEVAGSDGQQDRSEEARGERRLLLRGVPQEAVHHTSSFIGALRRWLALRRAGLATERS